MPVILFAVFIDLVGFGIIVPILPFLTMKYGGDALTGTALISIYSLMAFVGGPIWGRLSDRIGRKPALALTFMGGTLSYVTLAFSETLGMLFLARAMSGAMAGNVGIVMASLADTTDQKTRGKALGYLGAVFGLGFAVGPGIGGLLSNVGGETSILLPGLTAAGLALTAMILTYFFVPETSPAPKISSVSETSPDKDQQHEASCDGSSPTPAPSNLPKWSELSRSADRTILFLMFIIVAVGQSVTFSITPFWVDSVLGWTESQTGYLMTGVGLSVAVVQSLVLGPIFRLFGEVKTLILAALFTMAGVLVIRYGNPVPLTALIGFPVLMTGMTSMFPAMNSILSQRTNPLQQGAALGTSNGFSALGRVVGPLSAGYFFSATDPGMPFLVVVGSCIAVIVWSYTELQTHA